MVEQPIQVDVQIAGRNVPAGALWTHRRGQSESATFSYREDYLQRADAYELDPGLPLQGGQHQTAVGQPLFGAMSDCAPDGWGRRLVRRAEAQRAREADTQQRGLTEAGFLLGARDDLRQGALRFRGRDSEEYLATDIEGVPHLVGLSRLLNAAEELERDEPTSEDLRLLLHGGSSLGGARPKAHVLDTKGRLSIAKFPSPQADEWDVIRWEAAALTLAANAGITVPEHELHVIEKRPVLVVRRFDRDTNGRIGYLSAMSMLQAKDGEQASYLEIGQVLEERSSDAVADLRELWRRIVFTILISNTDDHLRNHGFLRTSTAGWSLSPAFDLNPNPEGGAKQLATAIDETNAQASLATALEVAGLFRLSEAQAREIVGEVSGATARWRDVARARGLGGQQLERLEPAFEHEQSATARELVATPS
ncbi:MAG TPA: type II toxin-antitoxin system HipA family toxin [Solirubrobacteraceae bacterium]|jgi:serine/threonine-protein kinase HipA|nr:type II toxin-antitoxin system HipA family toxin [Solirubrobacteraceae bacterium]